MTDVKEVPTLDAFTNKLTISIDRGPTHLQHRKIDRQHEVFSLIDDLHIHLRPPTSGQETHTEGLELEYLDNYMGEA